jgi:hypothetical protein
MRGARWKKHKLSRWLKSSTITSAPSDPVILIKELDRNENEQPNGCSFLLPRGAMAMSNSSYSPDRLARPDRQAC